MTYLGNREAAIMAAAVIVATAKNGDDQEVAEMNRLIEEMDDSFDYFIQHFADQANDLLDSGFVSQTRMLQLNRHN
jgi:hypothetical protein